MKHFSKNIALKNIFYIFFKYNCIGLANQTINRRGVYEDLDAKGRRAKEFDSCIWAENNGNYKSFNGEDLTLNKRNKLSSTVSWLNKHTEVVNNADRDINPLSSTKDQLSSHVLPMDDYSTANINPSSHKDLEHEAEQRRELEFKMSNAGFKKIDRSGNQQNGKKANILELYNRNELISEANLKQSESAVERSDIDSNARSDISNMGSIRQFDRKNTLNISGLRKQEFMTSQLAINNHYENHINKQIDDYVNPTFEGSEFLPSDTLNHKEK